MHVTIDGYGGDLQKLADEDLVRAFLDTCPTEIGMTKIAPPHVCRYVGSKPRDWGISGFVLIAESHISVHTFPEHGYLWVDIFSCKSFDAAQAIEDVRERFLLSEWQVHMLPRGLEYPDTVTAAAPHSTCERYRVAGSLQPAGSKATHPLLHS
jgi:S-adenosylmethionine decarboxylase